MRYIRPVICCRHAVIVYVDPAGLLLLSRYTLSTSPFSYTPSARRPFAIHACQTGLNRCHQCYCLTHLRHRTCTVARRYRRLHLVSSSLYMWSSSTSPSPCRRALTVTSSSSTAIHTIIAVENNYRHRSTASSPSHCHHRSHPSFLPSTIVVINLHRRSPQLSSPSTLFVSTVTAFVEMRSQFAGIAFYRGRHCSSRCSRHI